MLVAFAASAVGIGLVAAQQRAAGAAACTALGAGMFAAVTTLTATYDAGSWRDEVFRDHDAHRQWAKDRRAWERLQP